MTGYDVGMLQGILEKFCFLIFPYPSFFPCARDTLDPYFFVVSNYCLSSGYFKFLFCFCLFFMLPLYMLLELDGKFFFGQSVIELNYPCLVLCAILTGV